MAAAGKKTLKKDRRQSIAQHPAVQDDTYINARNTHYPGRLTAYLENRQPPQGLITGA